MPRRMLHFRFTFAVLACLALLLGALLETVWLAGPGAVAAAISDLFGILQARARFPMPADRALRGGAEALPALGLAALEPAAIAVTVAVVLYALMANGIQTVGQSRGLNVPLNGAETLRRLLAAVGSTLAVSVTVLQFAGSSTGGVSTWYAVLLGSILAAVGGLVSLAVTWLEVRKAPAAPNVDT